MPNQRLAHRYAKSLIDLAIETNQLDAVFADISLVKETIKSSKDFALLLQSPIIKADKKTAIINAVLNGKVSALTTSFSKLLINKGREADLLEIANAFIEQYNTIKGIKIVQLTTATEISNEVKKSLEQKVSAALQGNTIQLQTQVNEKLIGGFVLEFENKLLDASILRDLNDIKQQFSKNLYIQELR
jgi:F-type H+-transporting ATPase subunit delta